MSAAVHAWAGWLRTAVDAAATCQEAAIQESSEQGCGAALRNIQLEGDLARDAVVLEAAQMRSGCA